MLPKKIGYRNARRGPSEGDRLGRELTRVCWQQPCMAGSDVPNLQQADAGTAEVLSGTPSREEQRISAFQEYANGGLAVLQEFFSSRPADLDGLLTSLIVNERRHVLHQTSNFRSTGGDCFTISPSVFIV